MIHIVNIAKTFVERPNITADRSHLMLILPYQGTRSIRQPGGRVPSVVINHAASAMQKPTSGTLRFGQMLQRNIANFISGISDRQRLQSTLRIYDSDVFLFTMRTVRSE
jgi:hypothetical protein